MAKSTSTRARAKVLKNNDQNMNVQAFKVDGTPYAPLFDTLQDAENSGDDDGAHEAFNAIFEQMKADGKLGANVGFNDVDVEASSSTRELRAMALNEALQNLAI